jgi:hypothetical protein
MASRIKTILILIIGLTALVLVAHRAYQWYTTGTAAGSGSIPEEAVEDKGPFVGLGLRYDGYYMEDVGGILYLIRFFPEGRAVLVNGTTDLQSQLPPLLVRTAKGDPAMGYYNVAVRVDADSLFFTTKPEKGTIDYRGVVVDDSRVRFLRHSHINGTEQLKEYVFQPDTLKQ